MFRYLCLLFLPGLLFCKKIKNNRPECLVEYLGIPQDTSFLSTPLLIPTQLIEDKLNQVIRRDLLSDDDFDSINADGKKDKLKLKITRLGKIRVRWLDNVATIETPLLVLIERRVIRKNVLPFSKALALKTQFSLQLVFEITVQIGEDWTLRPKTRFVEFKWLSKVRALGGLINVENMVERRIQKEMPAIVTNVDSLIHANVRLDRVVGRVWQQIQKPMIINRKEQLVWLKINPIRFETGRITTQGSNLMVQARLYATTQTLLGDTSGYTINTRLPPLIKKHSLPDTAFVYMLSKIPFSDINSVISKKLIGKNFAISGHDIQVTAVEVYGCNANIVLHLSVCGSLKAEIYMKGIPRYEPNAQHISIENFDFELMTDEALAAGADWLLHSSFKQQMQDSLNLPLAQKIATIPTAIERGIERGNAGEKMDFIIEQWDFRPQNIWVSDTAIIALILVEARVHIVLEKI